LDVVQVREARQSTNRGISEVAIGCCIHLKDECRKENMESKAKHANESITVLSLMGTQAIQRIAKVQDVEAISDEDLLAIQRDDDGSAVPKDWSKRIVAHANSPPDDWIIGNESRLIR
jgi:hypothetical protein